MLSYPVVSSTFISHRPMPLDYNAPPKSSPPMLAWRWGLTQQKQRHVGGSMNNSSIRQIATLHTTALYHMHHRSYKQNASITCIFRRASRYSTHHIQIPQGTQEKLTRKTPSLANSVARPLLITSSHTHSFTEKAQEKTPPSQSKSPTHKNAPITCQSHHSKHATVSRRSLKRTPVTCQTQNVHVASVGADVGDSPPAVSASSLVSFPLQHHRGLFHFPRNRRPRLLV